MGKSASTTRTTDGRRRRRRAEGGLLLAVAGMVACGEEGEGRPARQLMIMVMLVCGSREKRAHLSEGKGEDRGQYSVQGQGVGGGGAPGAVQGWRAFGSVTRGPFLLVEE